MAEFCLSLLFNFAFLTKVNTKINFRPANITDAEQIVTLFNSYYHCQTSSSYFIWQYFHSYYGTALMCAFWENRLIGFFGLQHKRLKDKIHIGQAIDLLIHPDFSG